MISGYLAEDVSAKSARHESLSCTLREAFWAAYLLTGCAIQAERAVKEAVDLFSSSGDYSMSLLFETVRVLKRTQPSSFLRSDEAIADLDLPGELQSVMQLAPELRACFVLRVLSPLPMRACAQLLGVSASEINQNIYLAMQALGSCYA